MTELAALLGTIPATLSRAFDELSTQGIISVNGAEIRICDRQRLQRMGEQ
ncbi:helix-turn-helix domain-containing protein [uncultured Thermosynechococcus sp.]